MGRGILRGAGGDENLKSNFIWPYIKFIETYYFIKFVNNVLTLKQYDFLLYFLSKSVEFIHFVSWFHEKCNSQKNCVP